MLSLSSDVLANLRSFADVARAVGEKSARHLTFNLRPLDVLDTAEVRMHSGTLDARKILLWVSLWQQILWAAAHGKPAAPAPDVRVITPSADIVDLARQYLPDAGQPQQAKLIRRLAERRREILELWAGSADLARWLTFSRTRSDDARAGARLIG